MICRRTLWILGIASIIVVALVAPAAWAQANPCASKTNPCAVKAQNPCAANPCAAKNPCGGGGQWVQGVARYVLGEVISVETSSVAIQTAGGPVTVAVDALTQAREGTTRKAVKDLKPKERVTVSVVEQGGARRAAFVYVTAAGGGNPCAGNPCAAKNPCAANPCAAKSANPCAGKANPCAAKNPCGAKR